MKISLKETATKLLEAQTLVLTAHVNPDGDAIGSCLGLMHVLQSMGKKVQVFIDDDIPKNFSVLPGYELIEKPSQKVQADLLVVLDTLDDRIGVVSEFVNASHVLNIDHHTTNQGTMEFAYINPARAAVSAILFELVQEMGAVFTKEAAVCLYTGIATDTGFFRYSNTTPFCMRAAADLMDIGVQPNVISEAMEQKSYDVIKGMADAMQTIELFAKNRGAGIFLDLEQVSKLERTDSFIDMVRVIDGVDVAVLLKCKEENVCRVSMRSKGIDVAKIASAFGGGGHVRAAGCTLAMPFEEAKDVIKKAVSAALEENA